MKNKLYMKKYLQNITEVKKEKNNTNNIGYNELLFSFMNQQPKKQNHDNDFDYDECDAVKRPIESDEEQGERAREENEQFQNQKIINLYVLCDMNTQRSYNILDNDYNIERCIYKITPTKEVKKYYSIVGGKTKIQHSFTYTQHIDKNQYNDRYVEDQKRKEVLFIDDSMLYVSSEVNTNIFDNLVELLKDRSITTKHIEKYFTNYGYRVLWHVNWIDNNTNNEEPKTYDKPIEDVAIEIVNHYKNNNKHSNERKNNYKINYNPNAEDDLYENIPTTQNQQTKHKIIEELTTKSFVVKGDGTYKNIIIEAPNGKQYKLNEVTTCTTSDGYEYQTTISDTITFETINNDSYEIIPIIQGSCMFLAVGKKIYNHNKHEWKTKVLKGYEDTKQFQRVSEFYHFEDEEKEKEYTPTTQQEQSVISMIFSYNYNRMQQRPRVRVAVSA